MTNVPLTITASRTDGYGYIALGSGPQQKNLQLKVENPGVYWYLVLDRQTLEVVANVNSSDNDNVPGEVLQFNNDGYILIVASIGVTINRVPQGALFSFLVSAGGGEALDRLEQVNLQLSCGLFTEMSYLLVGVMGTGSTITPALPGLEMDSLSQVESLAIMTVQLVPTMIDGHPVYSPEEVGS